MMSEGIVPLFRFPSFSDVSRVSRPIAAGIDPRSQVVKGSSTVVRGSSVGMTLWHLAAETTGSGEKDAAKRRKLKGRRMSRAVAVKIAMR